MYGAFSQNDMTTSGFDVIRFSNSLKNFSKDFSGYGFMLRYLIGGLKNRIPPEFGISGEEGTIKLDRLLDSYLGKKIDRDTTKICLGDSINPEEIDRFIDLIENDDSEWDIHAVDYGIALAACLITRYCTQSKRLN